MSTLTASPSSDLSILGDAPVSRYGPQDDMQGEFTKGKTFHPRIEFKSGQSNVVKARKFPCDHYALVKGKEMIDMGENFPALLLSYRYKALDFREKGKVKVSYDPRSPEFKAIQAEADRERPPGQMSGAMYGAEFLMAVKKPDGSVELATVLCGSASWKSAAKKMFGLVRKFASFGSKLIEGKFTYTAPEISTFGGSFTLESIPNLTKEIYDFANQSGIEVQDADVEEGGTTPPADGERVR